MNLFTTAAIAYSAARLIRDTVKYSEDKISRKEYTRRAGRNAAQLSAGAVGRAIAGSAGGIIGRALAGAICDSSADSGSRRSGRRRREP